MDFHLNFLLKVVNMVKLIASLLLCSFVLSAPVYADASISSAPKATTAKAAPAAAIPKSMSATQLKAFDGKNGHKAYVALNGKVYDVTNIDEWKDGKHYKGMVAGTDLTPYISQSPHGANIVKELDLTPVAMYKK
jgi:predicted heme/steroid binding protein